MGFPRSVSVAPRQLAENVAKTMNSIVDVEVRCALLAAADQLLDVGVQPLNLVLVFNPECAFVCSCLEEEFCTVRCIRWFEIDFCALGNCVIRIGDDSLVSFVYLLCNRDRAVAIFGRGQPISPWHRTIMSSLTGPHQQPASLGCRPSSVKRLLFLSASLSCFLLSCPAFFLPFPPSGPLAGPTISH